MYINTLTRMYPYYLEITLNQNVPVIPEQCTLKTAMWTALNTDNIYFSQFKKIVIDFHFTAFLDIEIFFGHDFF